MRRFGVVFALFASACAPVCPQGLAPAASVDLYFGRGGISDADWRDYLARSLVARFPDGMTVFDAEGRWRDPKAGRVEVEESRVVRLVLPDARRADGALSAAIDEYRKRFAQTSVLRVEQNVCHAF
ncbi:MAG: DUF3574 domain-containing protein [Rhodospirillales bacterium]|nr:DUF3574 domain-containing protein [Rhodospirillales bacterium]